MTISVRGVIFGSRLPRYGVNFARRFTAGRFYAIRVAPLVEVRSIGTKGTDDCLVQNGTRLENEFPLCHMLSSLQARAVTCAAFNMRIWHRLVTVNKEGEHSVSKGARLRAERERLGFTQEALSTALGHSRKTQTLYEAGKRSPDWDYLDSFSRIGADVLYILTGEKRSSVPMPEADDLPPRLKTRLATAIEAIEAGLEATGRTVAPPVKAELVLAAYDILAKKGETATAQIIHLLRA